MISRIVRRRWLMKRVVSGSSIGFIDRLERRTFSLSGEKRLNLKEDDFLSSTNVEYSESLYREWKKSPDSVSHSWQKYFDSIENNRELTLNKVERRKMRNNDFDVNNNSGFGSLMIERLIQSFRKYGHEVASVDPLNLKEKAFLKELDPSNYGLSFDNKEMYSIGGLLGGDSNTISLSHLVERLKGSYCGTVSGEFEHLDNEEQKKWLRDRFESLPVYGKSRFSDSERLHLLDRMAWAHFFEHFLRKKFGQDKRFGLEGVEAMVPALKVLIDRAAEDGVESVDIGMPHRGRLNLLANVLRKPLASIIHEFQKIPPRDDPQVGYYAGDVKYHLGTSYDRPTNCGKKVHIAVLSNPSHLEAVDPVVDGKTRAKQFALGDIERNKVLSIQIHGDSAFAGQGVVFETFQMSKWPAYTTGGTIHLIVNNQIGFTTDLLGGNCTDVAKTAGVPIFHANADDPEACAWACQSALDFRMKFHSSVVVDIVGYRRYGHNELDEPKFTHPLMYAAIEKHKPCFELYAEQLISEGLLTKETLQEDFVDFVDKTLDEAFEDSKKPDYVSPKFEWFESYWTGFRTFAHTSKMMNTGVSLDLVRQVGNAISKIPEGMTIHPALKRDSRRKLAAFEGELTEKAIDWGTAEALAFGTLLVEGHHVRLSGQDVERGTFSHRHSVLTDQKTGEKFIPLSHLSVDQAPFEVSNSPLNEFGVLGFELGYSLQNPDYLTVWEAQFGDFANGAQVIIDQFVSTGEKKWKRQSGLVMLLPHGYDGQGPEHSSARLERFLQLSDDDADQIPSYLPGHSVQLKDSNWQVVNVSTPANYFHVLRRQIHRDFRKPLVVMSPKNLLRHPLCKSPLLDFVDSGEHIRFSRIIPEEDDNLPSSSCQRLVFCSGKIYYELLQERMKLPQEAQEKVHLIRIEQIAPFPFDELKPLIEKYGQVETMWCQEEPKNMGAWNFVAPRFHTLTGIIPNYCGRTSAASPSTGMHYVHLSEQAGIVTKALTV